MHIKLAHSLAGWGKTPGRDPKYLHNCILVKFYVFAQLIYLSNTFISPKICTQSWLTAWQVGGKLLAPNLRT